jgi:hypothetical protein
MKPNYQRLATVISTVVTRMVLANPHHEEPNDDADDCLRESLDGTPDGPLP